LNFVNNQSKSLIHGNKAWGDVNFVGVDYGRSHGQGFFLMKKRERKLISRIWVVSRFFC